FAIDDRNAAFVADICRRLDGIPLALELVAARVRVLSVEEIALRLREHVNATARFDLLASTARTGPARQQTLRATIDWSHDLLDSAERQLLRRLSVFAGGWNLDAAEAVCSDDGAAQDVLQLLERLVDKSLVLAETQRTPARYRLLETVRQYSLE